MSATVRGVGARAGLSTCARAGGTPLRSGRRRVGGYHVGTAADEDLADVQEAPPEELLWGSPTPGATFQGVPVPEDGCAGEAMRALGGDLGSPELVQRINIESVEQAMGDPRVVAAFAQWSACMARLGFDYDNPWEPPAEEWYATPEPSSEEIAVASADVDCKEATEVIAVWHAVDVELQTASIADHQAELDQIEQDLRQRLDVARAVVDGRPS